jgi:membrane-bound metal-dependent hydrolase YbcI (DUF457 family)
MFLGHFGVGFGAKKAVPAVSLGALFLACQFADLVWPTLLLLGLEQVEVQPGATRMTPLNFVSYPYSHSLVALAVWGALFGVLYTVATRSRTIAGVTLGLLVLSHWFLDVIMHRPDLPITPTGTRRLGLGLWNSMAGTLVIELLIFVAGILVYLRTTAARDRVGSAGLWLLVAFLLVTYVASAFGPPPPGARAVAWSTQAMWLLVAWAYWVDRHRAPV